MSHDAVVAPVDSRPLPAPAREGELLRLAAEVDHLQQEKDTTTPAWPQPCPYCTLSWDAKVTTDCPLCAAQAAMLGLSEAITRARAAEQARDALQAAVVAYGQHRYDCQVQNTHDEPKCDCGLAALLDPQQEQ